MLAGFLKREFAALWRQPARAAAIALFAAVCLWSTATGLSWQTDTEQVLAEAPAAVLDEQETWFADLETLEAGGDISPYAARPMNFTVLALHAPAPLAALAYREETMHPHSATINGWRSEASLFRRYEVQGPSALWAGRFDLAFIVVAILPLLLLVLTFDVLSRERESGRLPLFLVQGGSVTALVLARVLAVGLPLALVPVAIVVVTSVVQQASAGAALLWIATTLVYTALWAGLATWIAVRFRSAATGALAVLAVWALIVVLIPSAAQFLAEAVHPTPSRVTYLSEARDAEAATRRNIEERAEIYMAEHPDQADTPDSEVPGFYRSAYLANVDINERTRTMIQALETEQAAQRRLVSIVGTVSPAIIAQRLFQAASGTGAARSAEFRRQARQYLNRLLEIIGPATVGQSRISLEEARSIPTFTYQRTPAGTAELALIAWLLVLALALTLRCLGAARRVGTGG